MLTGNKHLAFGSEQTKYLKREVGFFAGLKSNSEEDLSDLQALMPGKSLAVLFTSEELATPAGWQVALRKDKLVAMAGQRFQPDPYTEVSAVCTHPEHTGKGYAAQLVRSQICQIKAVSRIPFLHLELDNTAAFRLYDRLGFRIRKPMLVYVLEKES